MAPLICVLVGGGAAGMIVGCPAARSGGGGMRESIDSCETGSGFRSGSQDRFSASFRRDAQRSASGMAAFTAPGAHAPRHLPPVNGSRSASSNQGLFVPLYEYTCKSCDARFE